MGTIYGVFNLFIKRSKKQSLHIKRTVYLMTPAELLETAHDIIKEVMTLIFAVACQN